MALPFEWLTFPMCVGEKALSLSVFLGDTDYPAVRPQLILGMRRGFTEPSILGNSDA